MGTCGSFETEVSIEYSIKSKTPNTDEAIAKYLETNSPSKTIEFTGDAITAKKAQELFDAGKVVSFCTRYGDCWSSDGEGGIEEVIGEIEECYEDSLATSTLQASGPVVAEDLRNFDLEAIEGYNSIGEETTANVHLGGNSGYIYFEQDNREYESYTLESIKKYMDKPDAKIVVMSNGDGEG
jgi:hypothetical protein